MKTFVFLLSVLVLNLGGMIFDSLVNAAVEPPPKVSILDVKEVDEVHQIYFPAHVESKVQANQVSEIDARIIRILKPMGSYVKAGEEILRLENQDPAFTYSAVIIKAPISGLLGQMQFPLMAQVTKGDRLFTIIQPQSLKIMIEVPASQMIHMNLGLKGFFLPFNDSNQQMSPRKQMSSIEQSAGTGKKDDPKDSIQNKDSINVEVVGMSPIVDPQTGTASAELNFAKSSPASNKIAFPQVGSVGQVLISVKKGKSFIIPESALKYFKGKPIVLVLDQERKVMRKEIEIGETSEAQFKVLKGVSNGDKIVLRSSRSLKLGEIVEIDQSPNKETF